MTEFINTPFLFTAPVRKYKANDPYYWEVDNIPIEQLEQNCLWLKDQLDFLLNGGQEEFTAGGGGGPEPAQGGGIGQGQGRQTTNGGGGGGGIVGGTGAGRVGASTANIHRANFADLRPSVAGSTVSVEAGRFSARINDAYTLSESLSKPAFNSGTNYVGEGSNYFTTDPVAVRTAVNKIYSGSTSLRLNGLIERFSQYPINGVQLGGQVGTGGSVVGTGIANNSWTGFPLIDHPKFYDMLQFIFTNSRNNISYTESIAMDFTKRWRGVARTSIVDVTGTINATIPPFDSNDFFYVDSNGTTQTIPNVSQRIDLVFIYSKPVDQGSTTVISQGTAATLTEPTLGVLVGAGLGVNLNTSATGEYATVVKNGDGTDPTLADAFMLASKSDTTVADGGFTLRDGTKVYGSFPSPDDLLNLAPLLANELSTGDWRTIGQSVMPVAYVVVDSTQNGTIPTKNLIDIRPFFRTTELTYDERAGIAGATPSLSLANPAIGRRELATHIDTAVNAAVGTGDGGGQGTPPLIPRVVGGGYVWGGKKWGPEGAITSGMEDAGTWLENGTYNLSYNNVPDNPDWDYATWSQYLDATKAGAGTYKNDFMNFKYAINRNITGNDSTLDFQEPGDGEAVFTNSLGTSIGNGLSDGQDGLPAPVMMYWVKKRFWFTLPEGFSTYCVRASLANCVPLTQSGFGRNSTRNFESAGTEGVWINKGTGWFEINVGWVGPDPYAESGEQWAGWASDTVKAPSFPSCQRKSDRFRSWACLYPELGVTTVADGNASTETEGTSQTGFVPHLDANPEIKVDKVGSCTYPTVIFEVVGFPTGWENNGFQLYDSNMPHNGTATITLR